MSLRVRVFVRARACALHACVCVCALRSHCARPCACALRMRARAPRASALHTCEWVTGIRECACACVRTACVRVHERAQLECMDARCDSTRRVSGGHERLGGEPARRFHSFILPATGPAAELRLTPGPDLVGDSDGP